MSANSSTTTTIEGSSSKCISSSPNTSIIASSLSVISDSSTFGGANVTAYFNNIFAKSATFTEGVTGPTFHGDVKGTADKAVEAQRAGTAGAIGASGSASAPTNTATNTVQTSQPNTTMIASGLRTSPVVGIRQVEVDTFEDLNNVRKLI